MRACPTDEPLGEVTEDVFEPFDSKVTDDDVFDVDPFDSKVTEDVVDPFASKVTDDVSDPFDSSVRQGYTWLWPRCALMW